MKPALPALNFELGFGFRARTIVDGANMYRHFFRLREDPFNVNLDPRYLFLTPEFQNALDMMIYGIQTRKGLILLTGEVGTGKTMLVNHLLDRLRQDRTSTAFIFNSRLEARHLFDFVLADFGIAPDSQANGNVLMRLNHWLLERYRAGETAVLIVDEAQGLSFDLLEEIRMLLNLETPREKLLQVVLAGQPELEEKLKRKELRQLRQRITLRCKTLPLTPEQTRAYIEARLQVAGLNGQPVFAPEAMNALHFYSQGIPRVINLLCGHSLLKGYAANLRPVPASIVEEVARDLQFADAKRPGLVVDYEGFANVSSISAKSLLARASTLIPSSNQPTWDRQSPRRPICASVPLVVERAPTIPNSESGTSYLACDCSSDRVGGAAAIRNATSPLASTEGLQEEIRLGQSATDLTSEDAFHLLCELGPKLPAITSATRSDRDESRRAAAQSNVDPRPETSTLGLVTSGGRSWIRHGFRWKHTFDSVEWPIRWGVWRTMRWSSIASSCERTRMRANLVIWLKRLQSLHRRWPEWRSAFSPIGAWIVSRRMIASSIRWLQEPFGQMPGRLPSSRTVQVRQSLVSVSRLVPRSKV